MYHSIYLIGYALMATVAFLIILHAQYERKQKEGVPINFGIIKILSILSLTMWSGAAAVALYYSLENGVHP